MINIWCDLIEMKKEFPIGIDVIVDTDVEDAYWGEEVGGKLAQVTGYNIQESLLLLVTETGKEIAVYPDQVQLYFESQVC